MFTSFSNRLFQLYNIFLIFSFLKSRCNITESFLFILLLDQLNIKIKFLLQLTIILFNGTLHQNSFYEYKVIYMAYFTASHRLLSCLLEKIFCITEYLLKYFPNNGRILPNRNMKIYGKICISLEVTAYFP